MLVLFMAHTFKTILGQGMEKILASDDIMRLEVLISDLVFYETCLQESEQPGKKSFLDYAQI